MAARRASRHGSQEQLGLFFLNLPEGHPGRGSPLAFHESDSLKPDLDPKAGLPPLTSFPQGLAAIHINLCLSSDKPELAIRSRPENQRRHGLNAPTRLTTLLVPQNQDELAILPVLRLVAVLNLE